jgi:hypothetical protein
MGRLRCGRSTRFRQIRSLAFQHFAGKRPYTRQEKNPATPLAGVETHPIKKKAIPMEWKHKFRDRPAAWRGSALAALLHGRSPPCHICHTFSMSRDVRHVLPADFAPQTSMVMESSLALIAAVTAIVSGTPVEVYFKSLA